MATDDPSKIIRDKPRKRGEYHGYGPDGYKPSPYAKARTNVDLANQGRANPPRKLFARPKR